MTRLILIIFFLVSLQGWAQDFGVGTWREHLPYNRTIAVDVVGSKTYAATPYGLYYFDSEDNNLERFNKINGLSDFSVTAMQTNQQNNTLIVGYQSGNIDLIKNGRVINVSAIVASNLLGDKQIYGIHNEGKYAYLACGFGIVVLDVTKEEVKDTYIIGVGGSQVIVYDIAINDTKIYAATDEGIYSADKNNAFLADHTIWNVDSSIPNFAGEFNIIHYANDKIYANLQVEGYGTDTLYFLENGVWNQLDVLAISDQLAIENKEGNILVCQHGIIAELDANNELISSLFTYNGIGMEPNGCIWDGNNYCIADDRYGLNISKTNWTTSNYLITGPSSNYVFDLDCIDDKLWVATGRVDGTIWNNTFNSNGIYSFDQYDWSQISRGAIASPTLLDSTYDFVHVTIDPTDPAHAYASSFSGGVVEIQGTEVVNRYSYYNSTLQVSNLHGGGSVKVSSTALDGDQNLWVANPFTNKPLSVLTSDGEWMSFNCGSELNNQLCIGIMVDQNDDVWISFQNKGILVYDFNDTPLDASDDQYKLLTNSEGNGNLPSRIVTTMVEDLDGEVWVGTESGPAVFYNTQGVFDNSADYDAQQVLIDQDGSVQLLLETENISDIQIDGGNRKWFATKGGGLFLMSADASELIYSFTKDNSPLFSNNIIALAMNHITGELYIGTDLGIMGYKGEATVGENDFSDVYAYPNPVRSDYTGTIGLKGLMENSDVKITDAAGNLVFNTTAIGGQATWDGNNIFGERVASGVYYCFAVSTSGKSKAATKILFVQ